MASWRVAAAGVRRPVCQGGLRLEGAQRGSVRVAEQVSERVRALLPCVRARAAWSVIVFRWRSKATASFGCPLRWVAGGRGRKLLSGGEDCL